MWSTFEHFMASVVAGETSPADRSAFQGWLDAVEEEMQKAKRTSLPWPPRRGPLELDEALRVAKVAEAVLDAGGPGSKDAVTYLLLFVASCPNEALLPFWERVMPARHAFSRRDLTAPIRASLGGRALRALAARGVTEARGVMIRVLSSLGAADRGALVLQGSLPTSAVRNSEDWIAAVRRTALEDADFEARYLARCALRILGEELQEDSSGAYSFKLRYRDFSCVVEVASGSSLYALHEAVQCALRWDEDHLWCFYLNGRRGDQRFVWPGEDWALQWYDPSIITEDYEAVDLDLPRPENIGEFGLRAGNQILYHFDFGDDHLVPLKVQRIGAARARRLPAVTDVKGKRPLQYR